MFAKNSAGIIIMEYDPLYAYGGASKEDSALLDWAAVDAGTERGWGFDWPYFRLSNMEDSPSLPALGEVLTEEGSETTIGVRMNYIPRKTVDVVVAQYKHGQFADVRIVTVDPEEFENVILMTFGTDPDAEYRVFALDAKLTPLMDAYDIPWEEG